MGAGPRLPGGVGGWLGDISPDSRAIRMQPGCSGSGEGGGGWAGVEQLWSSPEWMPPAWAPVVWLNPGLWSQAVLSQLLSLLLSKCAFEQVLSSRLTSTSPCVN